MPINGVSVLNGLNLDNIYIRVLFSQGQSKLSVIMRCPYYAGFDCTFWVLEARVCYYVAFRLHCTTEHMYGLTLRPLIKDASVNRKIGTSLFQTPRVGVPVTRSSFLFFDFL